MPDDGHLSVADIKDFAPGLWQVGDWLSPPSGAQEMVDCYPQTGSGLRAFFKPSTLITTGIGAGERIVGFFGFYTGHRTLATNAVDFYCMTYKTSDAVPRLYRFDQTDATQTQWTLEKSFAAGTALNDSPLEITFLSYQLSGGTTDIVVALSYVGADSGIWTAPQASVTGSQTWTALTGGTGNGPMTTHQNRLVFARGATVWFTDPGTITVGASNFVEVEPQRNFSVIVCLIPNAPSDLLVGKLGAAWSSVQGSLTDPTVRTMSDAHTPTYSGLPVDTGQGIAFIEAGGGVYLTNNGSSFARIDSQLNPLAATSQPAVTLGDVAFYHRWLFVRGRLYDFDTKSWFRSSWTYNAPAFLLWLNKAGTLYAVTPGTTPAIYVYNLDELAGARANAFTWKSTTLHSPDGRQVVVRQIEVIFRSYVNTSSLAVTVGGTTITKSSLAVGKQTASFFFHVRGETLDVQVVSSSGDTSNEAPSIEGVRVGTRSGHRTH